MLQLVEGELPPDLQVGDNADLLRAWRDACTARTPLIDTCKVRLSCKSVLNFVWPDPDEWDDEIIEKLAQVQNFFGGASRLEGTLLVTSKELVWHSDNKGFTVDYPSILFHGIESGSHRVILQVELGAFVSPSGEKVSIFETGNDAEDILAIDLQIECEDAQALYDAISDCANLYPSISEGEPDTDSPQGDGESDSELMAGSSDGDVGQKRTRPPGSDANQKWSRAD